MRTQSPRPGTEMLQRRHRTRALLLMLAGLTIASIAAGPAVAQQVYVRHNKDGTISISNAPSEAGYEAQSAAARARVASTSGNTGDPDTLYRKAKSLLDAYRGDGQKLQEAEGYLRQILQKDPNHALAYVGLARVAAKTGYISGDDFDPSSLRAAQQYVDRALQINPQLFEAHLERGFLYMFGANLDGARKAAQEAQRLRPEAVAEVAILRAWIAKRDGNPKEEERQAQTVLKSTSDRALQAEAYQLLAAMYRDRDQDEQAHAAYRKVLELDPSAWAKVNYANFLIQQQQYDRAIELSKSALAEMNFGKGRRTLARAYARRAEELTQKGQPKEAIQYGELGVQADPEDTWAYTALSDAYEALAKIENNRGWAEKAEEVRARESGIDIRKRQLAKQAEDGRPLEAQEQELVNGLRAPDWQTRNLAAQQLGAIIPPPSDAVSLLLKATTDENEHVRSTALISAVGLAPQDPAVIQAVAKGLVDSADLVRENAGIVSKQIGAPAVPGFVQALAHEDSAVRNNAAIHLASMGTRAKEARPALERALNDQDSYVRRNAAQALQAMGATGQAEQAAR